jgi:hypothetical protein
MNPALVENYPGNYDFAEEVVFPLKTGWFLGRLIYVPRLSDARVRQSYGENWSCYPEGHAESDLTVAPFQIMPVVDTTPVEISVPCILRGPDRKRGMRGEVIWAVPAKALGEAGVSPQLAAELPFSTLVFANDRRLWGEIHVGLRSGREELLILPSGWCSVRRDVP